VPQVGVLESAQIDVAQLERIGVDHVVFHQALHHPSEACRDNYEGWNESWLAGDFCHISQESDQGQSNRPFPGMERYVTPIKGLYLGGASAWPGPVVSGGGRVVAQVLFEEMEIDFDAVING